MTAFSDLFPLARGLMCLLDFLTILLFQYSLLRGARHSRNRRLMTGGAIGGLASYALMQFLLGESARRMDGVWTAISIVALFAAALLLAWQSKRHSEKFIETASIKESVDGMPIGVCCYWPDGLVKLVNERMEALSYAVTGGAPRSGERLWDALERGEGQCEFLQTGENPVVRLPDGCVWSVRRESVELDGDTLYEIVATDLTDEYAANDELKEKRERVGDFNRRLRELNREIERMTVEKEVLTAKVSIHDDLGHALLYAKQYYQNPGAGDRETLLRIWGEAIHFLKNEGPEHWRDLYAYVERAAGELGVSVHVDGTLPQGGRAKELFSDALICCTSNAARHGGADALYVTARETADAYTLRVTNNGSLPGSAVAETGGLKNLREKLERAGGAMRVDCADAFAVNIELPKEEKKYAVPGVDR